MAINYVGVTIFGLFALIPLWMIVTFRRGYRSDPVR